MNAHWQRVTPARTTRRRDSLYFRVHNIFATTLIIAPSLE